MAYKYINPGIADLFDEVSPSRLQFIGASKMYSRTSGHCFNTAGVSQALYLEKAQEYWFSMGIHFAYSHHNLDICFIDAEQSNQIKNFNNWLRIESRKFNDTRMTFRISYKNTVVYEGTQSINVNTMYQLEFYVKDDPGEGAVKVWADGKMIVDFIGTTGEGNGFNRVEINTIRSSSYTTINNLTVLSDLVVQNTGRIGDMRVNVLPYKTDVGLCEWEVAYPVGFMISTNDYIQTARTYILSSQMFTQSGKIKSVRVSQRGANPAVFKFCLFRKNQETGKYSALQATGELVTSGEGVQELAMPEPLTVETGDYLGFYSAGNFHCYGLNKACLAFNDIDATNMAEVDLFAQASYYGYAPSVHAMFVPEDKSEGYREALSLPENLAKYVFFTTNEPEKKILSKVDGAGLKIGRIDSLALTAVARFEGESTVSALSSLAKAESAAETAVGEKASLSSADRNYVLAVYGQNPLTRAPWKLSDLDEMLLGIQSRV